MMNWICPACGAPLREGAAVWKCERGHCFDVARQGYVNLLTVQQKHSLHPGDTREQVLARRAFLDGGYYAPITDALCDLAARHGCAGPVLDAGCGEGSYCTRLAERLGAELIGVDISKEAVRAASARYKGATWLCATASHLPVADGSVGLLTSLFSVTLPEEFSRVLRGDGAFIQVLAAPDHLLGLKGIIYPKLTQKEKNSTPTLPGFRLIESVPLRFSFTAEGQQVQNLLYMTPHVFRIGREGAQRLAQTARLTDTASCVLNIYKRENLCYNKCR